MARIFAAVVLAAVVIAIAADHAAIATMPAPKPGALAEPKSTHQTGFPDQLYKFSLPPDNPQTPAKIALGKALFFDPRLSVDDTVACANCHDPDKGFTDQLPTSMGVHAKFGQRNAPTILDSTFNIEQFWDGRRPTLEDQARDPILNPVEMGMPDQATVVKKINSIPEYQQGFMAVFHRAPDYDDLVRAIAAYERTLIAFDSPFDRFMAGDASALTAQQQRGWAIFNGQGRCMSCHGWNPTRPTFSDDRYHNIGVSAHSAKFVPHARQALALLTKGGGGVQQLDRLAISTNLSELGRFLVTKQPHDIGAFRTMDLRNLYLTEPYFHDGSQATIWDTLDHYNKGGVQNPFLDGGIVPLGLSEQQEDDLAVFLLSLTSEPYMAQAKQEYERQFKNSRTTRPQRDTAAAMGHIGRNGPGFAGPFGDIGPGQNEMSLNPALLGGD
ncbi:MAG TPA: cytochrome c peroxidase [Candidatus Binataceae bacterium]|nr:cytochrome c peroxidase [Candidatus Binataceae bacterium]HVB78945.1 cytochrome c peroxidase [Candidatus Binataceae bacterium]